MRHSRAVVVAVMADRSIASSSPPAWVASVVTARQLELLAAVSLWRELLQRSTLKGSSRHIGHVISQHSHAGVTNVLTHEDLVARTGHGDKTVSSGVAELVAAGWMTAVRSSRREPVLYTLTWPPESRSDDGTESRSDDGTEEPVHASSPGQTTVLSPGRFAPESRSVDRDLCVDEQFNESSSSVGGDRETVAALSSDDDDRFRAVIDEAVELKVAAGAPDRNPAGYRSAVARSVPAEHGDALRQVLVGHPEWPARWVAQDALGLPRTDPTPREVIDACPECVNGMVDTGAGMDYCPSCSWARDGDRAGAVA